MEFATEQVGSPIVVGRLYTYIGLPLKCQGHRYRVLGWVLDVPSYQKKVIVEAQTGPDQGLLFCCTPANFVLRYLPLQDDPPPAEEAAPCENPS